MLYDFFFTQHYDTLSSEKVFSPDPLFFFLKNIIYSHFRRALSDGPASIILYLQVQATLDFQGVFDPVLRINQFNHPLVFLFLVSFCACLKNNK